MKNGKAQNGKAQNGKARSGKARSGKHYGPSPDSSTHSAVTSMDKRGCQNVVVIVIVIVSGSDS